MMRGRPFTCGPVIKELEPLEIYNPRWIVDMDDGRMTYVEALRRRARDINRPVDDEEYRTARNGLAQNLKSFTKRKFPKHWRVDGMAKNDQVGHLGWRYLVFLEMRFWPPDYEDKRQMVLDLWREEFARDPERCPRTVPAMGSAEPLTHDSAKPSPVSPLRLIGKSTGPRTFTTKPRGVRKFFWPAIATIAAGLVFTFIALDHTRTPEEFSTMAGRVRIGRGLASRPTLPVERLVWTDGRLPKEGTGGYYTVLNKPPSP